VPVNYKKLILRGKGKDKKTHKQANHAQTHNIT